MAAYPGGRVFVAEQEGLVVLYGQDGAPVGTLLDIRSRVSRAGNEEGFLSLALDPDFPSRPYLYAYYSVAGGERRTRLSRFEVQGDAAVPDSELAILEQPQPFSNHNGGAIRFGPDGMLYLGFGDGGSQGDPANRAQDLGQWLGKMLRIDVRNARDGASYEVPGDNPWVGVNGARPEIWAFGFRNPWRVSFDVATGSMWVADVGQNAIEEIDVVERGSNQGWSRFEGERCFKQPCDGSGMTPPVAFYTHSEGCSVSGGVVYRGRALPALIGHYLYADFCSGRVWGLPVDGGDPVQLLGPDSSRSVASFGTDADGEVYLLVHGGAVQKIVAVE
jgi:glucose/arabinose dehydrogenase